MPFRYKSMQDRIIANSVLSWINGYKGQPCWDWIGQSKVNKRGYKYPTLSVRFKRGPRKGKVRKVLARIASRSGHSRTAG